VLKDVLRGRGIRLMFLNACESARSSRADYNKGVAPGLVADGVPAVLANQYSVLDRAATVFSQHFYWCLAQGLTLGDAMRESRIALKYSGGDLISWAVPVLFARNPDARLCEKRPAGDVPFSVLPGVFATATASASRQPAEQADGSTVEAPPARRYGIALWDITDSFNELDDTIARLNAAQDMFEFFMVNLSVPYGTWRVEKNQFEGVAYLSAERVARRLRNVLPTLNADYLYCVTDRPLADKTTYNLYFWADEESGYRINLISTWGFQPPLRGTRFNQALANVVAGSLAYALSGVEVDEDTKGSLFYANNERDMRYITGRLSIPRADRRELKKSLPADELTAVEALSAVFHDNQPPLPLPKPRRKPRAAAPRKRRKPIRK
jgi:hypothetical protein